MKISKSRPVQFFIITMILCTSIAKADLLLYKTYEDYKSGRGEKYKGYEYNFYWGNSHPEGTSGAIVGDDIRLTFKEKGGEGKVKFKCKDYWGFQYNDSLFRMDTRNGHPTRVINAGKICYYENGMTHLAGLPAMYGPYNYCYLSKDLNSEFCPMPADMSGTEKRKVRKFEEQNPEYKSLFDCIHEHYSDRRVRYCVESLEGK